MFIIPLQPVPAQNVQVQLDQQNCTLNLYQLDTGLYMDVSVSDAPVVIGVLCLNLNLIVRSEYLGFAGDFYWIDNFSSVPTNGSDPYYTGIGDQFSLAYLLPSDLPTTLGVGVS